MCWKAPRMLRSPLRPDMNSRAVKPFTSTPPAATAITVTPAVGAGCMNRITASQAMPPVTSISTMALDSAARIVEPRRP